MSKARFLVIDDMSTIRKLVKKVLQQAGFSDIQEFPDAHDAWEFLKEDTEAPKCDFIISDWNMPIMKGIELLKHCRASKHYSETPFLMLTAENESEIIKEVLQNGVDGYVLKPFTPDSLKKAIATAYQKRKQAK